MKLYLAGPMSGYRKHDIPMFQVAADYLRWLEYEVVSPAEGGGEEDGRWPANVLLDEEAARLLDGPEREADLPLHAAVRDRA